MATIEKILLAGLQSAYDSLASKDSSKLYFCTDTMNMYKGEDLYTDGIRKVSTKPGTPAVGKLYYITGTDTLEMYDGSEWTVVRYAMSSTVSSASTAEQIPDAKAVYDFVTAYVEGITGSSGVVTAVAAGSADATISVTDGAGTATSITVPGVVTTPTWDSSSRVLTLPTSTGDTITVNIGKDIFVSEGTYDATSGNIVLTLNDGNTIEVPASALVDVYSGGSTTTATVSVSDSNEITATVKVSSTSGNALTSDSNGLYISLADYCTTSAMESAVQAVADDLSTLSTTVASNTSAINTLNGDSSTAGSVAYQVAAALATASSAAATAQAAAEAAQDTADENAESISDLEERVEALEGAVGFGEF